MPKKQELQRIVEVAVLSTTLCVFPTPQKVVAYDVTDVKITHESIDSMLNSAYSLIVKSEYSERGTSSINKIVFSGHGSCVAFSQKNGWTYILTAGHVVSDEDVKIQNGKTYLRLKTTVQILDFWGAETVEVLSVDEKNDIAICRVNTNLPYVGRIVKPSDVHQGDVVYSVGFPMSLPKQIRKGIISGNKDNSNALLMTAPIIPGDSGGPCFVLDEGKPRILGVHRFYFPQAPGVYGISSPKILTEHIKSVEGKYGLAL